MDNPLQQATQTQQQSPSLQDQVQANIDAVGQLQQKKKQEDLANYTPPQQNAAISQALATLKPNGKDPQTKVGTGLNTPNYSGLCLQYVDDQTGNKNRQPTAYADYQQNAASGNIKTDGVPPKGARVYFAPTPDNPAGHVGLSTGDGSFTGATTNQGIKTFSIKDWENYAGQQFIGYAPPQP